MNARALVQNIKHSIRYCPTWHDRINRLMWLYSDKPVVRRFGAGRRHIGFRFPNPVHKITVSVRDNGGSDAFIFSELFEHRYYDFDLPFAPRTIMDLGSNIGFTAIFFSRKYPAADIACVEPVPDNAKLLRENIALNGVRARVFEAAVAIEDGRTSMELVGMDYGHKIAGIEFGLPLNGTNIEVEAISMDTLMAVLGWDRISLLKVDIEGYEGILLKQQCEWLRLVDAMCIECHEGYGFSDLSALASEYGFDPPRQLRGTALLVRSSR